MRVFEVSVLVKIFGREDEEVTGNRRQQHNATLHDFYCYLNVIRVVNRGGRDGLGMWNVWGEGKCTQDLGVETRRIQTTWKTRFIEEG
jgi:hypothetical protein